MPEVFSFELRPVPPFRLDFTAWALRREPVNIVDRWDGNTYRRVCEWEGRQAELYVVQQGAAENPVLSVSVSGKGAEQHAQYAAQIVKKALGTDIDLASFYELASRDSRLEKLVARFRGLKPPRFPSVFEALVNGIACQQISLAAGIRLLNKLAAAFGPGITRNGPVYGFPEAGRITGDQADSIKKLGFSGQKTRAIVELSAAVNRGLDLEKFATMSDRDAYAGLNSLRGVGRWTAEYVLLRGLGRIHVFPADDVGARNKLVRWLQLAALPNYESVQEAIAGWRSYGGLIYFHLLLNDLAESGRVKVTV